jgi:hypothetical protein
LIKIRHGRSGEAIVKVQNRFFGAFDWSYFENEIWDSNEK